MRVEIHSQQDCSHLVGPNVEAALFNDRWMVQQLPVSAISVVDFRPHRQTIELDRTVSQIEYGFRLDHEPFALFDAVVVHRHEENGDGFPHEGCEKTDAEDWKHPLPDFAIYAVTNLLDKVLTQPNPEDTDG